MGLNQGGNFRYYTVKNGKIICKEKDGTVKEGYSYTGKLKEIRTKEDTYEGNPLVKIELILQEEKETACLQFLMDSWFSHGFFARARKIDLNKPITLGASSSEESKATFCWVKQGKDIIKKDPSFPKPKDVTVGKKAMKDWGEPMAVMESIINEINGSLRDALKDGTVVKDDPDLPFGEEPGQPDNEPF
jgi:hypothetical protein